VVWGLLLQDDPEGPTLIDYIVVAKRVVCRRLVLLVAHSKLEFQGELYQTRVVELRRHLPKTVGTSRNKIRTRETKLRVIKQVEKFKAELNTSSFCDRSFLEQREIEVVNAVVVNAVNAKAGIDTRFTSKSPIGGAAKQFTLNRSFNRQFSSSNVKWQLPQTLVICLKRKLQPELDKAWVTKTAANHSKPVGRIVPR